MNAPVSVVLSGTADYSEWRHAARGLLANGVTPERVAFRHADSTGDLFAAANVSEQAPPHYSEKRGPTLRVPRAFPPLATTALCHRDDSRFAVLYRLLWRLDKEPRLLDDASDKDVFAAQRMAKAVRRDAHKMKAFVRFRRMEDEQGEAFIAWFEPEHHIVERIAPFFSRRFTGMRWSIVTPDRSAHWDGSRLSFGDGASRAACPNSDALENHWRVYYASIFNPARLKVKAMQAEMPVKYWRNLPESRLIPELTRSARKAQRAAPSGTAPSMAAARRLVADQPDMQPVSEALPRTVPAIAKQVSRCSRCELCMTGTGAVPGEGPADAKLMLVGEQPGDTEDLAGRPFVGPAGGVLDRALIDSGIRRDAVYLTNAVKHFRHQVRGKQRIHQRPNAAHIEHCRWWLDLERDVVAPQVTVALGATAARALLGRPVNVTEARGQVVPDASGKPVIVTLHPAYLLRLQSNEETDTRRAQFLSDLRLAASMAHQAT